MDLHIMSSIGAIKHRPDKPTYAIRIYSSAFYEQVKGYKLRESIFYRKIVEYIFDDNDRSFQAGPVTITNALADTIVGDFAENKAQTEALLVHCTQGQNRSPAVVIALNEIFTLGQNSEELCDRFKRYNRAVYRAIMEAGERHVSK